MPHIRSYRSLCTYLFSLVCAPLPALNHIVYRELVSHLYSLDLITQDSPFLAALQT
jgi:hypothetical protein